MMQEENTEWFVNWFNSKYYHQLYGHRDDKEAEGFIDNLMTYLKLPAQSRVWDMCCGKGRHAKYLSTKGFKVTGSDLSEESIACASRFANENLEFAVHDIRNNFRTNYYDAAFNLFTSFGYFEKTYEERKVFFNFCNALKPNGVLMFDFLNAELVTEKMIPFEEKVIDNTKYIIKKKIENQFIIKDIAFEVDNKMYSFQERVKLLREADFDKLAKEVKLSKLATFGDYNLNGFNVKDSSRLIVLYKK